MRKNALALFTSCVITGLSACGGGGGDSDSTDPNSPVLTQEDIRLVASLGVLTTVLTGDRVGFALGFFGGLLVGSSTDTGGSRQVAATSCASASGGGGTLALGITKSAVRAGLNTGDEVTYTFVNCDFGTGTSFNGAVRLVARSNFSNLATSDYQVSYAADTTSLILTSGGATTTFVGKINAETRVTASNAVDVSFAVVDGETFSASVNTGAAGTFNMGYGAGTTYASTDVISPNSASRKLDGAITTSATGAAAVPITIATPTALAGTNTASGSFVATSGVINTRAVSLNAATSTTFSGDAASVSGDSDGNGSLDLVFSSTWAALTGG